MSDIQEQVSVPQASASLADGIKKLVIAAVANHKAAAGSALTEVSADVTEAVKDLGPVLAQVGLLGGEVKAEPVGVAESLVIAALEVAKALLQPGA